MQPGRIVPPFRYMSWAKRQSLAGVAFHLGLSGLAPPPHELLPLDALTPDLEQRGRHMPPLLAQRMRERLGIADGRLMLTLGTSHALYVLCASRLRPGDLCLVERPAYEMLATLPTLFGATVERFDRSFDAGWKASANLAERIRERSPAMVLLSNPHNPTGMLMRRHELVPIVRAAEEVGALVAVDEVYLEYLDDPSLHTAFGLSPCVATASSFTKALGLGTIRLGWLCADEAVIDAALAYNDYISVLYPNPSAWVGLAALDRLTALKERATRIAAEQLQIARDFIASRADLRWHAPDAGVIGFVELPVAARPFCERLLAERQTLLVPGDFFEAPRFVRLGFGGDREALIGGLERFAAALDEL